MFGFALAALPFLGLRAGSCRVRLALSPPPGDVGRAPEVRGLRLIQVSPAGRRQRPAAGFDLEVGPGAVTTVMGPSGCGKSSLLSYLCGTLEPVFEASGEVWLDGVAIHELPPERRRVGILFQDDLLFPHLSVGENLAFALPPAVRGRRERRARIEAALREADLAGFGRRDPATLSGGQRARVALMRTLLAEPQGAAARRAVRQARPCAARPVPAVRVRARAGGRPADAPGHPRRGRCRGGGRRGDGVPRGGPAAPPNVVPMPGIRRRPA